jgi:hypothetical protein
MKKKLYAGTTSHIERVFIQDTSQTDGRGLTGLVYNSASLSFWWIRQGDAAPTSGALVTATVGTWASCGFKEVDATKMPGVYELHVPNAAIASGAKSVLLMLKGATNMAVTLLEIELDAVNYQDAVNFGLSGLGRVLGLTQDNWVLRDMTFDGDDNLTAATIRVYDTAGHAATDDGSTGLLYTYSIANTYSGGLLTKSTSSRTL